MYHLFLLCYTIADVEQSFQCARCGDHVPVCFILVVDSLHVFTLKLSSRTSKHFYSSMELPFVKNAPTLAAFARNPSWTKLS
jgi:hypothetical protein